MKQKRFIILTSVLAVLVLIAIISTLTEDKKSSGNFSSELAEFSEESVTQVQVFPLGETAFKLEKAADGRWTLLADGKTYHADSRAMDQLMRELTDMKAQQVVSRSRNSWSDYSVDDSAGVRLQVYDSKNMLADMVIGRMDFGQPRSQYQQQPETFTYVRMKESPEVYKVRGMLSMFMREGQKAFRSGLITKCEEAAVGRITYTYPADSSFTLLKQDSLWLVDGTVPDSAQFAQYFNTLKNFTSRSFAGAETGVPQDSAQFSVAISGPAMETIKVDGWQMANERFLVVSSLNPNTVFDLSGNQFTRLFKGKEYFLP